MRVGSGDGRSAGQRRARPPAVGAVWGDWGSGAYAAVTLGHGLHLLQAALLHLRDARRPGYRGNIWTGVLGSLALATCPLFFAAHALNAQRLAPF